jgi:hypothetical protein
VVCILIFNDTGRDTRVEIRRRSDGGVGIASEFCEQLRDAGDRLDFRAAALTGRKMGMKLRGGSSGEMFFEFVYNCIMHNSNPQKTG